MTPRELADLHARCLVTPRPWSEAEFAALLSSAACVLHETADGFLLGRIAGGEAELLTLAVDPAARRAGYGRELVRRFQATCAAAGAEAAFLEVASDNAAALALYRACGWSPAGLRRNYYAPGVDAVVMRHGFQADGLLVTGNHA